ncbi:MAG TPA: exodeoxyribonuclease VII small subunit [Clostridiales bacterium]|nr:exodeoxyribonuclease VII small subunit [Clostridiales bacterium]
MAAKKQTFEQAMSRLEEIVRLMERGECGLDESLKLFEEGAKLAGICNEMLDKAEQKVDLLVNGATGEETPFVQEEG